MLAYVLKSPSNLSIHAASWVDIHRSSYDRVFERLVEGQVTCLPLGNGCLDFMGLTL